MKAPDHFLLIEIDHGGHGSQAQRSIDEVRTTIA